MLRVIVSPAKKMLAGVESSLPLTVPALAGRTRELLDGLLGMTAAELQALWRVSDRLLGPCLDDLARLRETGVPSCADDLAGPRLSRASRRRCLPTAASSTRRWLRPSWTSSRLPGWPTICGL